MCVFLYRINSSHAIAQPPCIYYRQKKVQICMTECVLIKGFKQSLLCSVSVSLMSGYGWLLEHVIFDSCQARVGDIKRGQ